MTVSVTSSTGLFSRMESQSTLSRVLLRFSYSSMEASFRFNSGTIVVAWFLMLFELSSWRQFRSISRKFRVCSLIRMFVIISCPVMRFWSLLKNRYSMFSSLVGLLIVWVMKFCWANSHNILAWVLSAAMFLPESFLLSSASSKVVILSSDYVPMKGRFMSPFRMIAEEDSCSLTQFEIFVMAGLRCFVGHPGDRYSVILAIFNSGMKKQAASQ